MRPSDRTHLRQRTEHLDRTRQPKQSQIITTAARELPLRRKKGDSPSAQFPAQSTNSDSPSVATSREQPNSRTRFSVAAVYSDEANVPPSSVKRETHTARSARQGVA